MQSEYTARTEDAEIGMLGAEYWTQGKKIEGIFDGVTQEYDKEVYHFKVDALEIDGEEVTTVHIPSLAGFIKALMVLVGKGAPRRIGDTWVVRCTGVRKSKKEEYSDRANFEITIIPKRAA